MSATCQELTRKAVQIAVVLFSQLSSMSRFAVLVLHLPASLSALNGTVQTLLCVKDKGSEKKRMRTCFGSGYCRGLNRMKVLVFFT